MLHLLSLIVISVVSLVRADLFPLRQQCWHDHPLSTVNLQCSREAEVEYAQLSNAAISNCLNTDDRTTHEPWSYPPVCTDVLPSVGSSLCVYTNTSFSHGRGISILTTPELAERILVLPPFQDSEVLQGVNDFTGTWYTQGMPGKGIGMLAKRDLVFKDRITAQTPALLAYLESDLSTADREKFFKTAVSQLPKATREMYLGLATVYGLPQVKYQDVVKANTFQLEIHGHNHLAVFPETSRLNHACAPNAQYYLDATLLTHFVHITRPVRKGEEITISYTSPLDPTHVRQQHLEQGFHFRCTCARCTDHERTDTILQHIQGLQSVLNDWSPSTVGSPGPQLAEQWLEFYRDEGLEGFMDVPYGFAALAYNAVGDEETAVEYARRAEELILLKDGKWAPNLKIMRELLRDPRGHWSFGRRLR
ncbi:SET domain-containing protein [Karstenula rhodostoma CBS 690.94]|uniref:SET domain-containing protein n=1 Tax=Karstenula rhodostoma CBS 690.94 TaxID=1392251 RepID=A0A9P4UFU8_9PLEO|nr:SET domain-containing protein [Karstenula rhodostoma CBS 690.94]